VTQSPKDNNIGPAESGDWQAITSCVRAAYAHYVPRIGREPAPMTADYKKLIARSAVYVFREQEHVRAVLVIVPEPGAMFIENVAVDPAYQGRGIGRRLLLHAEQLARNAGLAEMRLYTNELMTENIEYYCRLGYEEVERRTEHGFRRVFMRKILHEGRGE
jgi:ribosomal protein S18 acetylase RimI-like enzyme